MASIFAEEEETDEAREKKRIKEKAKQEFFAAIEEEGIHCLMNSILKTSNDVSTKTY